MKTETKQSNAIRLRFWKRTLKDYQELSKLVSGDDKLIVAEAIFDVKGHIADLEAENEF